MSSTANNYLILVRPEPADGAVMREVVRVIRAEALPSSGILLNQVPGGGYLPEVGYVNIYNAGDVGLDADFCNEAAGLWAQALDYNRAGTTDEGYSDFLRRFAFATEQADRLVHAALTADTH